MEDTKTLFDSIPTKIGELNADLHKPVIEELLKKTSCFQISESLSKRFYPKFHDIFNILLSHELKKNQDAQPKEKESTVIINFFLKTQSYKNERPASPEHINHRAKLLRKLLALRPKLSTDDILSFMSFRETYLEFAKKVGEQESKALQKDFYLYWLQESMSIEIFYHLLTHNLIPDTEFSNYLSVKSELFNYMKSLGMGVLNEIISENTPLNRFFLKKESGIFSLFETDYISEAQKILTIKTNTVHLIN